jgi:hypothetical protein
VELCLLYWLAGILEGEGTFVSGPPSQPNSPIARISMTDLDTVTRAARLLDRAVTPARPREPHYKPVFITQIKGSEAVALMIAVRPVLGPDRTTQIERVLAAWAPRRRRSRAANPGRFPLLDPIDDRTSENSRTLSWLAGLLEGEGTFSLTCDANRRCYPVLSVQMCDGAVVRKAAQILGARKVRMRVPGQPHWRPTYEAKIGGAHAAAWMRRLWPLMCNRRQVAIERALAWYRPVRLVDPPATCVVTGCGESHRGRGLCHKHYMMWSRDKAKGRVARIAPLR